MKISRRQILKGLMIIPLAPVLSYFNIKLPVSEQSNFRKIVLDQDSINVNFNEEGGYLLSKQHSDELIKYLWQHDKTKRISTYR